MKFIPKILALLLVFGISTFSVFAINSPINIVASNISESSWLLSWDASEDALGYNIYYSTTSPIELLTAEKKEYINNSEVMLDNLSANTQYYYMVSAFDSEGLQSDFSEEYTFLTEWTSSEESEENIEFNSAGDFKLSSIEVLAQNQISLSFTALLENSEYSERIFKVVEKNDELLQYSIKESILDESNQNKVIVTFEEILPVNTEFKLTVISILDETGRNLESWIESFENFIIEEEKLNYVFSEEQGGIIIINDDNTTTLIDNDETTTQTWSASGQYWDLNQEKNSEGDNSNQSSSDYWVWFDSENEIDEDNSVTDTNPEWSNTEDEWNTSSELEWKNIDSEDVAIDLLSAGQEAEVLPTTWPEHIFMLILALVFGAMTFVFKFKK